MKSFNITRDHLALRLRLRDLKRRTRNDAARKETRKGNETAETMPSRNRFCTGDAEHGMSTSRSLDVDGISFG